MPTSGSTTTPAPRHVERAIIKELLFQERAAMLSPASQTISVADVQSDMELTAVNYSLRRTAANIRARRNQFLTRFSMVIVAGSAIAGLNTVEHLAITANEKLIQTERATASPSREQQLINGHQHLMTADEYTFMGLAISMGLSVLFVLGSANKLLSAKSKKKLAGKISDELYERELPPELCDLLWWRPRQATLHAGKYSDTLRRVACEAVGTPIHLVMGIQPGNDPELFRTWQVGAAAFLTRNELLLQADGNPMKESDQILADILLARVLLAQEWLSIPPGTGFNHDARWIEVKQALHDRGVSSGLSTPTVREDIGLELAPA